MDLFGVWTHWECSNTMEALGEALSCPVCLELFTPPVLVLTCAHNFCKQCLEKILIHQNCSHVNGQFCCPMCRKVSRDAHLIFSVGRALFFICKTRVYPNFSQLKGHIVSLQGA
uniref:RING-type domain-containing protein n=1 Tax=Chelonoidis abingdonii TaxID=106734 RepID=A0A8C0QRN5_CHEAB